MLWLHEWKGTRAWEGFVDLDLINLPGVVRTSAANPPSQLKTFTRQRLFVASPKVRGLT
jgi:hypothetical protein